MRQKRRVNIYACFLGGFFAFMAVGTYFSYQMYLHTLPVVETVMVSQEIIRSSYDIEPLVYYADQENFLAPGTVKVSHIEHHAGEKVKKGELLFIYDLASLEREACFLENKIDQMQPLIRIEGEYAKQLQRLEVEEMMVDCQKLYCLIENGGCVYSPFDGMVIASDIKEDLIFTKNEILMTVGNLYGQMNLVWDMPTSTEVFNWVDAQIPVLENGEEVIRDMKFNINGWQFMEEKDTVRYTAGINGEACSINAAHGQRVNASVQATERKYANVLPIECVHTDDDGREYVYLLMTKETTRGKIAFIKQYTVNVIDSDGENAAINVNLDYPVVSSHSGTLEDLIEVRLGY